LRNTVIDCKGLVCPEPVLKAKEGLENISSGAIEVIVDNEASKSNVERFGKSRGCSVETSAAGGVYHILITRTGSDMNTAAFSEEDYTCELPGGDIVYVVSSDTMGRGEEELGRVLMRAFIKTIKEMDPGPAKIIFYNTGVRLTATDSDLIEPLRALESQGVEISSCGTCLDYLNLKHSLKVGRVTNMYDIMDSMTRAAKIVSPH